MLSYNNKIKLLLIFFVFILFFHPHKTYGYQGQGQPAGPCEPFQCSAPGSNNRSGSKQLCKYDDPTQLNAVGYQTNYYSSGDCDGGGCSPNFGFCPSQCNGPQDCGGGVCGNGDASPSQVCNGQATSGPKWCLGAICGYNCSITGNCNIQQPGSGIGMDPATCSRICDTPPPGGGGTTPTYTCSGTADNGNPFACYQSNCPSGFLEDSSKTCVAGNVCCYDSGIRYKCGTGGSCVQDPDGPYTTANCDLACRNPNPCTCGPWSVCSRTCGSGTQNRICNNCNSSVRLSQPCNTHSCQLPIGTCTITSVVATGGNSARATATVNGFNRLDWKLDGRIVSTGDIVEVIGDEDTHTFSNLVPGREYVVSATGWCQTPGCTNRSQNCRGLIRTTPSPRPPSGGPIPPPNLQCWGAYEVQFGTGVARWVAGVGTGVHYNANFNLQGSSGYRAGEGCYRPGRSAVDNPPEFGTLGGKIWVVDACTPTANLVNHTANLTQPQDQGNMLYWVWSTSPTGAPMCILNNGTSCQLQEGSHDYVSGANQILGTINSTDGAPLFSGNSINLISWDSTKFRPVGYYRYQHAVGEDCYNGGDGRICRRQTCVPMNIPEFFYWGGWACDGCIGPPGYGPASMINGRYPNPDAPYCMVGVQNGALAEVLGNARIDWVFERLGGSFQVGGYVYRDDNDNGQHESYETTGIPNTTITLSNGASTQTDASGRYAFTGVLDGSYTVTATPPEGYRLTYPVNGSAQILANCGNGGVTGTASQNFLVRPSFTISGYVKHNVDENFDASGNGICDASEPTFAGTVSLQGYTQRNPISLSGDGSFSFDDLSITPNSTQATATYRVTADIGDGVDHHKDVIIPPGGRAEFCITVPKPWIRTRNGDVHSNTEINLPKGVGPNQ